MLQTISIEYLDFMGQYILAFYHISRSFINPADVLTLNNKAQIYTQVEPIAKSECFTILPSIFYRYKFIKCKLTIASIILRKSVQNMWHTAHSKINRFQILPG